LDSSEDGLSLLARSLSAVDASRVSRVLCELEHVAGRASDLPRRADLVNASFALPFCHEEAFGSLWDWIGLVLSGGGLFAGQFFGDRDEWADVNPRRHVTRERARELLAGYDVLHFDEVEKDGADAMGGSKHHHVFHVVARRTLSA
jgi:hypothetical protein